MTDTKTTPEFQPGDRVRVADDAAWADGSVTPVTLRMRGREATVSGPPNRDGEYPVRTDDDPNRGLIAPQHLMLIEPEPVPPAPEQVDAYAKLRTVLGGVHLGHLLDALDPLLPSTLTRPLPTEPGWYLGYDRVAKSEVVARLAENGLWGHGFTGSTLLDNPSRFAPFVPLVPKTEAKGIDRQHVVYAVLVGLQSGWQPGSSGFNDAVHASLLSQLGDPQ